MREDDRSDLLIALAIGAVLGAGAALLLGSGRRDDRARLIRELEPLRRDVHRRLAGVRHEARHGADRIARAGSAAADTARDALASFRAEVADIVEDAREEIVRSAKGARRAAGRARRR
jgi:gas vesicle protein